MYQSNSWILVVMMGHKEVVGIRWLSAQLAALKEKRDRDWRSRETILFADHDEMTRNIVSLMLNRLGFKVVTAVDGKGALSNLRRYSRRICAVFLDLSMPHMNVELLAEMNCICENVPIIVCGDGETLPVDGYAAGFIEKPLRYDSLYERLQVVLTGTQIS